MESFSPTDYSKLDDDRAWPSQERKSKVTTHDRSGRPDKTSWRKVRKVRLDHEEILLDGTAQSVRNGEALRDRSGRPDDIKSQEVARPQNFIMVNEQTELELSLESKSYVNRVNDQVRKRQNNFQCCKRWGRTFYDLGNAHGCNNGISGIHGKELPKQLSFHLRIRQISH